MFENFSSWWKKTGHTVSALKRITLHTRLMTKARIVIFTVGLISATLLPMFSGPTTTYADVGCSPDSVNLSGASWLNGGGVNVCSADEGNTNVCVPVANAPASSHCAAGYVWSGTEWQCVELVNRLYLTKGWTTATWYGNGSTLVNNLPSRLTEQSNGSISSINPGDVITLTNANDPNGHAAIINSISGTTVNIINQNADLNSSAYIDSGSLNSGNAHLHMNAWTTYTVQAIIHHPVNTPSPLRIGAVDTSGNFWVKEAGLSTPWTNELGSVTQGVVSGTLIGELSGGTFQVKEGSLNSQWMWEYDNVQAGALSDASGSNPLRIGVLTNGQFLVKEGSLTAQWTNEWTPTGTPVAGYVSGSRIGVLTNDGTFYVKDGHLDAQWATEATGVSKAMLSSSMIGVIYPDGSFYVKQGALDANWTWEYGGVASGVLSDATSSTPLRIGYVDTSGTFQVKEGSLTAPWTWEYGGVSQGVLSGNLIGEDSGGTFQIKQGSLTAPWAFEQGWVTSGTLWSPN